MTGRAETVPKRARTNRTGLVAQCAGQPELTNRALRRPKLSSRVRDDSEPPIAPTRSSTARAGGPRASVRGTRGSPPEAMIGRQGDCLRTDPDRTRLASAHPRGHEGRPGCPARQATLDSPRARPAALGACSALLAAQSRACVGAEEMPVQQRRQVSSTIPEPAQLDRDSCTPTGVTRSARISWPHSAASSDLTAACEVAAAAAKRRRDLADRWCLLPSQQEPCALRGARLRLYPDAAV